MGSLLKLFVCGCSVVATLVSANAVSAAAVITSTADIAPGGGAGFQPYTPSAFSASSSDLIEGATASIFYLTDNGDPAVGNTMEFSSGGDARWTDGSLDTVYAGGDFSVDFAAYGVVNATVGDPNTSVDTFVTYDLGGLFNLSQIDIFNGWPDSGRDDASFNLFVSADGSSFNQIAAYLKPQPDNTGTFTTPVTNRHSITDSGGFVASGVQFVRFQFTDGDNGASGVAEIDIFGSVVPEPAGGFLGMLACAGALARRKRA